MKVLTTDADVGTLAHSGQRSLILRRVEEVSDDVEHFSELVRFVVMELGDDPDVLRAELGSDVHTTPPDVAEWSGEHLELVYALSDDGSGATVFVPRQLVASPTWRSVASIGSALEVPSGDATSGAPTRRTHPPIHRPPTRRQHPEGSPIRWPFLFSETTK